MKKLLNVVAVVMIFSACLTAASCFAASTGTSSGSASGGTSKLIPSCLLSNDLKDPACNNINIFITFAINVGVYIFGFIGALALLFFVYGGFVLILSQGNQEKVKKGTGAITAAVIGLVISFSAYALITFLSNTIGVKAEKRLNLIDTVYAAEEIEYCLDPVGCYCLGALSNECSAIADGDVCYGTVSIEPCEDKTVDPELEAKLLQEKIGEEPEAGQKSVSALVQSAKKLNPMKISSPFDLLAGGVNILLAFMGSIALLLYIYAGFTWMSAGGSADKITKAKKILVWTTFGILAMSGSYMLVKTILDKIG